MWSPIVFCFLVGFVFASNNPGWKDGVEYEYHIQGRSLSSLRDISNQQSGFLFRATLRIQPQPDGKLRGQITHPQYDEIHSELRDWNDAIPEEQLNWKPLKMSGKPFEVAMEEGRITSVTVSKTIPVWEGNMIKSFMSQFQLNVNGARLIKNRINTFPEEGDNQNEAVYMVMEETVTGNTETMYQLRPLPKFLVQSSPEAQYLDEIEDNEEIIECIKHKNYTNNVQLPAYFYGFEGLSSGQPATNRMGEFFSRESTSRILLTGTLKRFVIRKSFTVNEIFVSPTLSEQKSGVSSSVVNATLIKILPEGYKKISEVSEPLNLGNIVYSYEYPFSKTNEVHGTPEYHWNQEEEFNDKSDDRKNTILRVTRSIRQPETHDLRHLNKKDLSEIKNPAQNPLLPKTTGYEGISINNKIDVVQEVQRLAKEIGKRMHDSERDHHEELLDMFTNMVSLIRLLNAFELEKAANDLYTDKQHGVERAIWITFRDAVAQSGSGPALIVISEWLKSETIKAEEAIQVTSAMVANVRQPTFEYVWALFDLATSPEVQSHWPLNETMLLSVSDVVRRVYVNRDLIKKHFPVKSFESFDTEEAERFIQRDLIPYYQQLLQDAIEHNHVHKIHVLIRAIGKLGTFYILPIFQPYLEGKHQVSQFQRVLMILSMDRLVEIHPHTAQNILFKVCQNPGETREVRMAAVFQLMRTVPPVEMLQALAQYTNIDPDDYVSAVVKTSIEMAAVLEGPEFLSLRNAAILVKPFLTEKVFGLRHGANYLRSYFIQELRKYYKQTTQIFGSDDTMYPKGIRFTLRQHMGGLRTRLETVIAMVSSMDDLVQLGKEQTQEYQRQEKQQKERSQEQEKKQFSSQNIAKLLNLQPEEKEQLEGILYLEMTDYHHIFSFDNRTLEHLVENIKELENVPRKEISAFKLTTSEIAIAVPSELGVPLLFTYDVPMLFKARGELSAMTEPQFNENTKLQTPEQIKFTSDMQITVSTKIQGRLSVTAPFNHQQYFAGFDRHFEINVPVRTQVKVDVKNMNAVIEMELKPTKEHKLLHYSTIPFTSKVDVTNFEPITVNQNTKVIKQDNLQTTDFVFGKQSTGMAFSVYMIHSRNFLTVPRLARIFNEQNILDALRSIWDDNTVQYGYFNVNFRPQESSTRKVVLRLSYDEKYRTQPESDSSEWILNENAQPSQRQEDLMKKIASDIKNVQVVSLDSSLEFGGEQNIKYILTGAVAKSAVDPKSRVMVSYKRSSNGSPKPHELHFVAKSYIPNTNALDLEYILQNAPMADTEIKVKFGNSQESLAKIDVELKLRRSEERKQYLRELPMYKQCKEEIRAGNKQMPGCSNMTMISNLLDSIDLKVHHENLKPEIAEFIERYFKAAQFSAQPNIEIITKDSSMKENDLKIQARFHPDLLAVNVSVESKNQESRFKNIEVDELSQQILVVHPVFHTRTRLFNQLFTPMDTYIPSCVVDKTHINTFSNLIYPADISKHWTVMLQYIQGNSERYQQSAQERLRAQVNNYVVLVRENPESPNKKDIKIVFSTPETDYNVVEIDMTPSQASEPKAKVTVDGQDVKVSEKESSDIKDKQGNNRFVQIYALPNGEVKVDFNGVFYIVYDGARARISTEHGPFMKNIVGLCGRFSYQQTDDLTTPQGCIARDPEEFIKSYEVEGEKGKQIRDIFKGRSKKCIEKVVPIYADVITPRDYRSKEKIPLTTSCTYFKTKYVEQNGQICFTIHPQPTCRSHCQSKKENPKSVPAHCVKKSSDIADTWKFLVDSENGPDFTYEKEHATVKITVPENCSR